MPSASLVPTQSALRRSLEAPWGVVLLLGLREGDVQMLGLRELISRGLAATIALAIGVHLVGCGSASRKGSTPIGSPVAVSPSEPTEPTPRVHGPGEPDSTTASPPPAGNPEEELLLDRAVTQRGRTLSLRERGVVLRMLRLNEDDLISGLSAFAAITGGRYPSSMDSEAVMKEIHAGVRDDGQITAEQRKTLEKRILESFFMTSYYRLLVEQGKAPSYQGNAVTPQDGSAPLLWWKESENKYRVITGDLRAGTLTGEQLARLQSHPLRTR